MGIEFIGKGPMMDILMHLFIIQDKLREIHIDNLPCRNCPYVNTSGQVELGCEKFHCQQNLAPSTIPEQQKESLQNQNKGR